MANISACSVRLLKAAVLLIVVSCGGRATDNRDDDSADDSSVGTGGVSFLGTGGNGAGGGENLATVCDPTELLAALEGDGGGLLPSEHYVLDVLCEECEQESLTCINEEGACWGGRCNVMTGECYCPPLVPCMHALFPELVSDEVMCDHLNYSGGAGSED